VQADGTWFADFSVAVDDGGEGWGQRLDLRPGVNLEAWDRDDDGDATVVGHRVPFPRFSVNPVGLSLWGHEWVPGTTLTIEVDGAVLADDVAVLHDYWGPWWGPGDFEFRFEEGQIVPGDLVTVTDGEIVKEHTVTALEITDVDVDADTVSGATDSPAGSLVEVQAHTPWGWAHALGGGGG
jgi:hypothetical protein